MINSDEVRHLVEHTELYYLSTSYLQASEFLCEAMISEDFANDFGASRVVLNLCHHGIELYLKAALMSAGVSIGNGHNLKDFYASYRSVYPSPDFEVPEIFGYEDGGMFPDHEEKMYKTLHQRYRYSSDTKGQRWPEVEGFIPNLFLEEIANFKIRSGLAWLAIEKNGSKEHS